MQSLALHALRALRKRKPQETLALASSQSWLPLLRPSNKHKRQPIGMLGRSSGNHDWLLANASAFAFLAVFVYATHATQAIAFKWKRLKSVVIIIIIIITSSSSIIYCSYSRVNLRRRFIRSDA